MVLRRRLATGIGAILLGGVALGFARASDTAQRLFERLYAVQPLAPLLLTPLVFALVVYVTGRWVPDARGSGIPQVMAASMHPATAANSPLVSLRTAAAKVPLTMAMLACGGAVGREGPTVQVGAAIMVAVHKALRVPITAGVYIAGGAAGVAAAFNTPLAGVAFAIEELASAYEQRVAVLVMAAVMIAGLVSLGIAGDYVYFGAMRESLPLKSVLIIAPVTGVVGGLTGGLFSKALLAMANPAVRFTRALRQRPVLFAAACGLIVAGIGIASGGLSWGTGYGPTRLMVEGIGQPWWFGIGKFFVSLVTAISGAPGGIFAPSLAVGAGLGNMFTALFPHDPAGAVVLLGMIGYFVGVVRAPLTGVIIISEITASRGLILPLFATALIADLVSTSVCREKLYHGLSKAFLHAPEPSPPIR